MLDPHPDLDQHQNLITSRGSCLPSVVNNHEWVWVLSCERTDTHTHTGAWWLI